jgi:hypothetical protein
VAGAIVELAGESRRNLGSARTGRLGSGNAAYWRVRPWHRLARRNAILTTLIVPKSGGVTSTKVNVVRWLKREGDPVKQGESVVELETEKVSYELESPAQGVLLKIVAGENVEVPVGGPLGYIGAPSDVVPKA